MRFMRKLATEPWGVLVQVLLGVILGWAASFGVCYLLRSHATEPWWWWVSGVICLGGMIAGSAVAFACIHSQNRRRPL